MEDVNGCGGNGAILQETFYILSKKNTVYRVRLAEKGLSLIKETNGNTKSETITLDDIIGCRCFRSKRKSGGSCACRPNAKKDLRVVEDSGFGEQDLNDISAYLYIYAYVLKKYKVTSTLKRERITLTLRFRSYDKFDENMHEAQKWRLAIKCLMRGVPIPNSVLSCDESGITSPGGNLTSSLLDERKILVLLNPKSGPGRARDMFQQKVVPLLLEAECGYDLHISKHANYVRDFVRSRDIYQWRAIVTLGGDGIVFEALNGLFERPDWSRAIKEVPIGVIPCGSGNGLAKSVSVLYDETYDQNPILYSSLNILKGHSTPLDLVRVETKVKIMYSFLSVGWGLLSDIDIESEKLRAIGAQRFTLWSVARLIGLRKYKGKVSYLPHPGQKDGFVNGSAINGPFGPGLTRSSSQMVDINSEEKANGVEFMTPMHTSQSVFHDLLDTDGFQDLSLETAFAKIAEDMSPVAEHRPRLDSFYSVNSRKSTYFSVDGSEYQSVFEAGTDISKDNNLQIFGPPSQLPSLMQPVPNSWTVREGEFVMVHSTNVTHLAKDCLFAPKAKLNDGVIWLLLITAGITRSQLLQFLLGLSSGAHVNCPHVELIPVQAFRLEPETQGSYITVDGEVVEYGPIQAEIMPGLGRIITR